MRLTSLLVLLLALSACHHPNPVFPARVGHIHKVVILGNSIVSCPPVPEKGWNNHWGMAASAREKDFVHLLIDSIHAHKPGVDVVFLNISAFERGYRSYDLHALDSIRGADLYIIKLAENVLDTATDYIRFYDGMIRYLDTAGSIDVIMDGFWRNPVNAPLESYAREHNDPFIHISDLSHDASMEARQSFTDFGVGVHPGDRGMKAIASRIWDYIHVYF
jgi:hypothetical protein